MTTLFCDVVGSTSLGEQFDPEALHDVLDRYFEAVSTTIARHGGTVQKYAGDAVLAVFGVPRLHEDDALRAVRAAAEINRRLPAVSEQVGVALSVRIGINTGLVITDRGQNMALGDAVNAAARLEQAAQPGEILIGAETLRLARDAVEVQPLGPLTLRGRTEPVQAFRLVRVDPIARGASRRLDHRLVDRERELGILREAWRASTAQPTCRLLTVLGAAGVGKSRLAAELLREVGDRASILRGRCLHYGDGVTFWALVEAFADLGEVAAGVLDHLSRGGAATAEELFLEVRVLLETLAAQRPVILHIDDLHWAEPMLIELLEQVAERSREVPVLILATARPDLLEQHPGWGSSPDDATTVLLQPLEPAHCEQLVDQLDDRLDAQERAQVIATSEGNPLFVQEMVLLAHERGAVQIPPTIQALLAVRLEGLSSGERDLLARGAVEGQVFHRSAVGALAGGGGEGEVESQLSTLVRKDLIRPHRTTVPGDQAFSFRHILIRDVAYDRVPKARRAELHQRCADWLERTAADLPERDELAGWHLEQAVRNGDAVRRRPDAALAARAAERLQGAAQRAADRVDLVASRKLLERALEMAAPGSPRRAELIAALVERLVEAGEMHRADDLLTAGQAEHPGSAPLALARLQWMMNVRPDEARRMYHAAAPGMLADLAGAGDERGLVAMHMLGFWFQWLSSQAARAAQEVRLAAEHARRGGDLAARWRALGWYVATLIFGPADVGKIAAELEAIEREQPGSYLAAFVDCGHAEVQRLEANFAQAIRFTERARDGFRTLGLATLAATCEQSLGWIELSADDAAAARRALLRSDAILSELGERPLRSTTLALLARAAELLDLPAQARDYVQTAEALSSPSDLVNFVLTHEARARLALRDGDPAEAERWARSALACAQRTDFVTHQAHARLGLARILEVRGSAAEGREHAAAGLRLFAAKGDRSGCASARRLLERWDAPTSGPPGP